MTDPKPHARDVQEYLGGEPPTPEQIEWARIVGWACWSLLCAAIGYAVRAGAVR